MSDICKEIRRLVDSTKASKHKELVYQVSIHAEKLNFLGKTDKQLSDILYGKSNYGTYVNAGLYVAEMNKKNT